MLQNDDGREGGRPAGVARGCALLLILLSCPAFVPGARAAAPVEMKDDRGVAVRLQAEPRRLVSLAPSLTEIVFLLGQEKKLVGVTRYCNYPPEAKTLPKIGGIADPDIERIVAAAPDLVLCTTDGNPREKVRALEEMGIPCFAVGPQDLSGIYAAIERIGRLLGVPARARREADALRIRANRAANRAADPAPGVLFVVSTSPIIAAGNATFMDELIRLAGGRNAAASFSGRYPRITVEDLIAVRPDLIFIAAMEGVESFPPEVSRWKEIPAFRDGEIVSLDGDRVTRPGPRMVAALEEVSRAVSAWRRRHAGAITKETRGKGR
ncbi:MAG: cobalamin-binding protein [Deltaproteobacteria bacterium]|nr:cobalamin-binding protein [Deltaproteobacteria bacterium]PWB67782.1 MAG: cobalamin-binding protein [Deltaproteobacteria bacterium]